MKMKKYSLLLFTIIVIGQLNAQENFNLGIKVGQNFTSISSVAADRNKASYHAGVAMHVGITKQWGITPEIILSQTKLETAPSITNLLSKNISRNSK